MGELYIVGGSNSLMAKGWTAHLSRVWPGQVVRNASVGATTSLMGTFRILRGDVPPGATVVWEYALNESNHFRTGQSLESLLYHLDWFMEVARRKDIRVLPLLLWTRAEQVSGKRNAYRKALRERLRDYGLTAIDAWEPLQDLGRGDGSDIAGHFEGNMHYAPDSPFQPVIAGMVRDQIGMTAVPNAVERLSGVDLTLSAPDGEGVDFSNSVLRAKVHPLDCDLVVQTSGRLLASFVIAAMDAGAVTLSGVGSYSLQRPSGGPAQMRLLKHLVHWQAADDLPEVNGTMAISGRDPESKPIVQNTFDWRGPLEGRPRSDAYICALVERRLEG
ncbi:SGNH/GDSL hydrolase family protein [Paracoccus sp. (in: a-proteobacteria)]|uniref:SGNH/GDSL hydrolase family protein n=1 Tax=Paracoccus sp. TaxID=267 RepID=UPI0028A88185|nr:SGNH/GDSL hydrolase family protein [Paracoccus sp. (in: a-proteobacteria)]